MKLGSLRCIAFVMVNLVVIHSHGILADDAPPAGPTLTINSVAPELDIEHWVQDGEGFFKPVTKFEKGKVYIVEFWATWCPPCVASMPHLSALQNQYRDQGLQIVSVSDEDLETVEAFLKREAPSKNKEEATPSEEGAKRTFAELTKNYCLTTDPDGSTSSSYMQAAQRNGIPCAFIVGKSHRVEWIGHPMQIDEPLAAVLAGTWDAEKFAVEFKEEQLLNEKRMRISRALRSGTLSEQMQLIEDELQTAKGTFKSQLQQLKLNLLLSRGGSPDQISEAIGSVLANLGESPNEVNNFAWTMYQMGKAQRIKDLSIFKDVKKATELAAAKATGRMKAMILDTLAHLYHLEGNLDKAIASQREAVASEGSAEIEGIAAFLTELEQEKNNQDKPEPQN
jgi:thiol-disulfide isomerase/thioredoxin